MKTQAKQCVLIEDEFYALELLESFIKKAGNIEIAGKFRNPLPAYELLSKGNIDLLFLDVDLPQINGLAFLNQLPVKPVTIITTAHANYASQAFEQDVADYLVKPYSFERFQKAIVKADRWNTEPVLKSRSLQVKANGYWVNIPYGDIIFIEGWKEYVKIHCADRLIVSLLSLTSLENELPEDLFIRIHKSYIVALKKVQSFNAEHVFISPENKLPIARSKKDLVLSFLKFAQHNDL